MDSPKKLNPTWTPESFQMLCEDYAADAQAASELLAKNLANLTLNPGTSFQSLPSERSPDAQAASELLAKSLGNLTLSPSTNFQSLPRERSPRQQNRKKSSQGLGLGLSQGTRHERRRVRTVLSARRERMRRMLQVIRRSTQSLLQKDPEERKLELEARARRFRCSCLYCYYHGDPSDTVGMEDNDDIELV